MSAVGRTVACCLPAGDTTANLAQIFDFYYQLIKNPKFAQTDTALSYADQYMCALPPVGSRKEKTNASLSFV